MRSFEQDAIPSKDDFDADPAVWDVVIVGAGVAGSTLAAVQGKESRRVLLLERDLTQPDRIVGELLQPGGYQKLQELGLREATEGIDAQEVEFIPSAIADCDSLQVYGYGLFKDGRRVQLDYPDVNGQSVAGRSFHHGRFVQRLRRLAADRPSVTVRQGTVKALVNDKGEDFVDGQTVCGVRYRSGSISRIVKAHLTIVCDGMYSTLRKTFTDPSIQSPSYFIGFILKNVELPFPNHGHVVLGKPAPVLFYPIGTNEVRCLVDYPGEKLPNQGTGDLKAYIWETVMPEIPESLREAFEKALTESPLRSVQNKQMPASPVQHPGALIIGDAYNMRHPVTGGGMTVALSDCQVLCAQLSNFKTFSDIDGIDRMVRSFHLQRKPLSCTINTLANALYKVFLYTEDDAHELMRQACFDYISLGGTYSGGPIALLGGLDPRPIVLIRHFFQVALFGVGQAMTAPSPEKLWRSCRLLADAVGIIYPILRDEGWNMLWVQKSES